MYPEGRGGSYISNVGSTAHITSCKDLREDSVLAEPRDHNPETPEAGGVRLHKSLVPFLIIHARNDTGSVAECMSHSEDIWI
jgi:hypothetical protein